MNGKITIKQNATRFTVQYVDLPNSYGGSHFEVRDTLKELRHSAWNTENSANDEARRLNALWEKVR
jgi:hypothetical protein